MKRYPSLPDLADAPDDLLAGGHLWLQEQVAGRHLRLRMDDSGLLTFGDRETTFPSGEVPVPYGHAVWHVREAFDRDAFRDAADPDRFVFFAQATVNVGLDYDWARTPPVLGFDVWDAGRETFLPADAVERAFDRLGLAPVNAFEKEVPVRDFHPGRYAVPDSAWYDGPARGVVVRNTNGTRATVEHPGFASSTDAVEPVEGTPNEVAERLVTGERVRRVVDSLGGDPAALDPDRVADRVLDVVVREEYARLTAGGRRIDRDALRSALGGPVREWLRERA